MPVKIKNIKGALVEKRPENFTDPNFQQRVSYEGIGANKAIDQQGEVEITLNRERLAIEINKASDRFYAMHVSERMMTECLFIADAIISAEAELLEVVK